MEDDPAQYWQDLTANYRQMSDGELLELAAKPEDLTDVAQQVLRDEMKLRNLTLSKPAATPPVTVEGPAKIHWEPRSYRNQFGDDDSSNSEGPREYTWKVTLCECQSRTQAKQFAAALQRAGIDSWIQAFELTYLRILVAADQLEQAQAVAAQPIPQDIIDKSIEDEEEEKTEPQEFEAPHCPKCGAADPILESADPVNVWLCESCGAEWTDPSPPSAESEGEEKSGA